LKKKLLASVISLITLAGCSSTPAINKKASMEIQSKINQIELNATLIRQQDNFVIAPQLSIEKVNNKGMFDNTQWQFDGKTLFPTFKSERFECNLSKNECERYTNVNSPFLKINSTKSDYGDTYQERVADGKKPGISATDVAKGGVYLLSVPGAILVGTPFALLVGTKNLVSHGSVWSNNWIEFNHDSFYEETVKAIQAQFGSMENYIHYMASASISYGELSQRNKRLFRKWNRLKAKKTTVLNRYQKMKLASIDAYKIEMSAFDDLDTLKVKLEAEMQDYYSNSTTALLTEFNEKLSKSKKLYIKNQVTEYHAITDLSSARHFIKEYEGLDEANLVGKVQKFVKKTKLRNQKESREKRRLELAKLASWRKILKIGDETFCGRVIEAKYPMFKIALHHPLQGYSDTIWLEKDMIFESKSGCKNRNNQLTPIYNPLK